VSATTRSNAEPAHPFLDPELVALVRRAEQGDMDSLPALREALDQLPDLWRQVGDLALAAERSLVQAASGPDLFLRESLTRQLQALRAELSEPSDAPVVRLLVGRAVLCWLEVHHLDALCAQLLERFGTAAQVGALERRRDHGQRRYLAALKALASTRRLLRPAVSPLQVALGVRAERPAPAAVRRSNSLAGGVGVAN
jgi:hypothetical protein